MALGVAEGIAEGVLVGTSEGVPDGIALGAEEGMELGVAEGISEGMPVGASEGVSDGMLDGSAVGGPLVPQSEQVSQSTRTSQSVLNVGRFNASTSAGTLPVI